MMLINKILNTLKNGAGFKSAPLAISIFWGIAVLMFAFTISSYAAWTSPTDDPPGDNVDAPINTGGITQYKLGAFGVGGVFETDVASHFAIISGNVGIGTDIPSEKLDVVGNIVASGTICDSVGCIGAGGGGFWTRSGSNLYPTTIGDTVILGDTGANSAIRLNIADNGAAAGARMVNIGDDTFFTDIDVANMLGIYGIQNSDRAGIRLGSDGSYIFGDGGNIGIGTTAPGAQLQVGDGTGTRFIHIFGADNAQNGILMGQSMTKRWSIFRQSDSSNNDLWFYEDNSGDAGGTGARMVIQKNTGNVGIGTTGPLQKLHVSSGNDSFVIFGPNSSWGAYLYVGSGTSRITTDRAQVISTNGNLHLDAATNRDVWINNYATTAQTYILGGNVGIGTTNPGYKLDVNGDIRISGNDIYSGGGSITFLKNTTNDTTYEWAGWYSGSTRQAILIYDGAWDGCSSSNTVCFKAENGNNLMLKAAGNNITIDFDSGGLKKLTVWAADFLLGDRARRGTPGLALVDLTTQLHLNYNNAWVNGTVIGGPVYSSAFFYNSDVSQKENIEPITGALDKILQLEGVNFDWKDNGKAGLGFIAQDAEKIFPELVNTNETTGLKSINYGGLTGPIIEAIKEQQTQIDLLKAEIESLKLEIEKLIK